MSMRKSKFSIPGSSKQALPSIVMFHVMTDPLLFYDVISSPTEKFTKTNLLV